MLWTTHLRGMSSQSSSRMMNVFSKDKLFLRKSTLWIMLFRIRRLLVKLKQKSLVQHWRVKLRATLSARKTNCRSAVFSLSLTSGPRILTQGSLTTWSGRKFNSQIRESRTRWRRISAAKCTTRRLKDRKMCVQEPSTRWLFKRRTSLTPNTNARSKRSSRASGPGKKKLNEWRTLQTRSTRSCSCEGTNNLHFTSHQLSFCR
jgi:hypothetical protein